MVVDMTDSNGHQRSVAGAIHSDAGDEILLSYEPLDEAKALRYVASLTRFQMRRSPPSRADKVVTSLQYEAYTKLALKTMQAILTNARKGNLQPPVAERASESIAPKSPYGTTVTRIHISHRLGLVPVGESSIVIAVSSPHRRESFEVAEWLLEQVKRDCQIWKEEIYAKSEDKENRTWKANFPA
ncbi:molybdopterin synthase [Sarracenia purpurea var. burkii]